VVSSKKKWIVMDCDERHVVLNEKTQSIQWMKWPTNALVVANSLWLCPRGL
jgi:hypothetical protein